MIQNYGINMKKTNAESIKEIEEYLKQENISAETRFEMEKLLGKIKKLEKKGEECKQTKVRIKNMTELAITKIEDSVFKQKE